MNTGALDTGTLDTGTLDTGTGTGTGTDTDTGTGTGTGTTEFRMPSLGADMEDGIVTEWLVATGDPVHRGQVVAVVETDKSDIEVEIFVEGTVAELLVPEGERVEVGTPIARIAPAGAAPPQPEVEPATEAQPEVEAATEAQPEVEAAAEAQPEVEAAAEAQPEESSEPAAQPPAAAASHGRTVTSPLVRHLADELHIDIGRVRGSGPGGRVLRADVERARRRAPISPRARLLAQRHGIDPLELAELASGSDRRPVTGDEVLAAAAARREAPTPHRSTDAPRPTDRADRTRRAIAALMSTSWSTIPHYHVASRIDVTPALTRLAEWNESHGIADRVLPAALWLNAVARAAAAVPGMNGWWLDDEFRPSPRVDLGVVVARRGGGIVVPTITGADELSVSATMRALTTIVGRVRANRLRSSDAATASLTVTNLGDLGADVVHGVIHPPQVALVGIGRVHEEPWAEGGELTVRSVVHVTVAADHRATDGLLGATFLSRLAGILGDIEIGDDADNEIDDADNEIGDDADIEIGDDADIEIDDPATPSTAASEDTA